MNNIQQAELGEMAAAVNIQGAWKRAMQLSYTNIIYEKAKLFHERNPDKHSLEAVGILRKLQIWKTNI